ncbi:ApaG [Lentisphaera araneosa HTCC2155]|uniref:ApaG n=1 Tax=Lentisphaera araneosa HTCC2155 TaxID=313628 RepID=A6DGR3_9BACT|nr:ApaG [Lentisphaera araneosa HTCC2155]
MSVSATVYDDRIVEIKLIKQVQNKEQAKSK